MDIDVLIDEIMKSLKNVNGLTCSTIRRQYQPGLRFIARYYKINIPDAAVDDPFLYHCFENMVLQCSSGNLSEQQLRRYRKCISITKQYISFGATFYERLPALTYRIPAAENEKILKRFLDLEQSRLAEASMKRNGNIIRQFLLYLGDNGLQDLQKLTASTISAFMEYMSVRRPASLGTVVLAVRSFVTYLFRAGVTMEDLSPATSVKVVRIHRIYGIFTRDEAERILVQIDTNAPLGKRDLAILLLASRNGLRSSDILNLKLTDIHWKDAEIAIVQKKTMQSVTCPIDTETGDALADYILHGRPCSGLPNVFLSDPPARQLTSGALCYRLRKYMSAAGVERSSAERISMHTFRRSLATSLLENDVPLETISQVLGHKNSMATKQYLSISERKLTECALSIPVHACLWEGGHD